MVFNQIKAPSADPVFYRTYSKRYNGVRETWPEVVERTVTGLAKVGHLTPDQAQLIRQEQESLRALPSGRWLWVGGTAWAEKPENTSGAYNCTSTEVIDWRAFGLMMDLAMMGCGTGAVLEQTRVEQLPPIQKRLDVVVIDAVGQTPEGHREEATTVFWDGDTATIVVGDSRQGWVTAYRCLLEIAGGAIEFEGDTAHILVSLANVRPSGETLKGFGGTANPAKLPELFTGIAEVVNGAVGRQLTPLECCLIIDKAALVVVAGNIRRCLPENALVHTDHGLVPIKDIVVGDMVQTPIGFRKVTNKFDQGVQDVYEIKTESTSFWATLNHKMATFKDATITWKHLDQLQDGDLLIKCDLGECKQTYVTFNTLGEPKSAQTYDIEVEEAHCFYCDGYLTHNSAGIRQFSKTDTEAATAKDNLWTQDSQGNWKIDPAKDALRMANHTRTWHHKPTLEELTAAVTKQFYSGEGAIQYVPEAIARANCDLLNNPERKRMFIHTYCRNPDEARLYLSNVAYKLHIQLEDGELDHRLKRYGLNPCLAGDTLIMTRYGKAQIQELVGQTVEIFDGLRWVETDTFRVTGKDEPTLKITLENGEVIVATPNHRFLGTHAQTIYAHQLMPGEELLSAPAVGPHFGRGFVVKNVVHNGRVDKVYCCTIPETHRFTLASGLVSGNCGEIIGSNYHCNLSEVHLNQIDPRDITGQTRAFTAAALSVASLLHQKFQEPRLQQSREWDPIVGVSFTGLFDFFVTKFGLPWLHWWQDGRPMDNDMAKTWKTLEANDLKRWRFVVETVVEDYCKTHGLRCPNRCTTVQPAGTKSLLTGASPGWHPPKAAWFIRRITFGRGDAVALACRDYGYAIVPSQSDKDEQGNLLNDPEDPRCTEWLVEIPTAVPWADIPGVADVDISQFSVSAQFDFYMQVQTNYVTHNSSATWEMREHEIDTLAGLLYDTIQADGGYISAAILARFDDIQTFPRLPFEPIDKATYDRLTQEVLARRKGDDFHALLQKHDTGAITEAGPAGCDSDKCLMPERK